MEQSNRNRRLNIVAIIEAAGKNGVSRLKIGDIEVEFGERRQQVVPRAVQNAELTPDEIERKRRERHEAFLEQLKIEDPLEYERVIAQSDGQA